MTDQFQKISSIMLEHAGSNLSKALLYCEVEDGVISADAFYQFPEAESVIFRFAPKILRDAVYSFWENGGKEAEPKSWAVFQLKISNGRFSAEFFYPNQLNPDEDLPERRPRAVSEMFPGIKIDYTNPNG